MTSFHLQLLLTVLVLFLIVFGKSSTQEHENEIQKKEALKAFEMGNSLYKKQDLQEAIQQYKAAIQLDPSSTSFYSNLGNAFREVGEFDESIKALQKALYLNENYAKSWYNLAVTYQTMESYQEAVVSYDVAISLDSTYVNAYYNKGTRGLKLGKGSSQSIYK
jgi:tetratricopeptide (TPR) repeat protein